MADPQAIVDAINAGDYDDELVGLVTAAVARQDKLGLAFGWRIKLDDDEWDIETTSGLEFSFAERALSINGRQFSYLELDPIRSMEHLVTLVVARLHHVHGLTVPEAFAQARKYSGLDLAQMVTPYEVTAAPKADDGTTSEDS